jgi:hypothetical protein
VIAGGGSVQLLLSGRGVLIAAGTITLCNTRKAPTRKGGMAVNGDAVMAIGRRARAGEGGRREGEEAKGRNFLWLGMAVPPTANEAPAVKYICSLRGVYMHVYVCIYICIRAGGHAIFHSPHRCICSFSVERPCGGVFAAIQVYLFLLCERPCGRCIPPEWRAVEGN